MEKTPKAQSVEETKPFKSKSIRLMETFPIVFQYKGFSIAIKHELIEQFDQLSFT